MKLVLFNEYRLGVIQNNRVVDAMAALEGLQCRRPQDLIEEVITRWDALKPRIEAATRGQEGLPLDNVRLRPPVPKPSKLIKLFVQQASDPDSLLLDFFAGCAPTAQAVFELNREDGGARRLVLIQLPEPTPEDSVAARAGFATMAELGKERIRKRDCGLHVPISKQRC